MPSIQIQKIQIKCPKLSLFCIKWFLPIFFPKSTFKTARSFFKEYHGFLSPCQKGYKVHMIYINETKIQPIPLFLKSCVWHLYFFRIPPPPHPHVGGNTWESFSSQNCSSLKLQVWTSRNILAIAHPTKNSQCKDCAAGCSRWPTSSFPNCSTSLELQVWTGRNTPPITHLHFFTQPPSLEYW